MPFIKNQHHNCLRGYMRARSRSPTSLRFSYDTSPSIPDYNPSPPSPRGSENGLYVRGPDRGTAFRNATPRGYDSLHNPGGGGTRAPDKHHNIRDKSRDSPQEVIEQRNAAAHKVTGDNVVAILPYRRERENAPCSRAGIQVTLWIIPSDWLNATPEPKDRVYRNSRHPSPISHQLALLVRYLSLHSRLQAQRADLWSPLRRLASNEILTIQWIEPRVAYPTPSQPAAWVKNFVTPPGGNIHPKSDPRQGSQPTQGPLGHGGISSLTGMSKSASEKTTSVGPPISVEPQLSLIKTKPVTLFLESSESDKAREETSQFNDSRVSRMRQSTSAKEKTVGNEKLRGRAALPNRMVGKPRREERSWSGVRTASALVLLLAERNWLVLWLITAVPAIQMPVQAKAILIFSFGAVDHRCSFQNLSSQCHTKKVLSLAKPITRGEPLYDFEVELGDLFGDGTGGYTDNFPGLDGIGMDTEEVEGLIEETDITPVVSDFNSRMPRRIEPNTKPETPIEVIVVKQPRSILEIYADAKKSILAYNSRKFKRVLTSVIPDRYSKDPPGPEHY
ncbi:hypothetical protein B9Z19DRAFT_1063594 [Tuber borchii]|uniref:Uncharacterized protein n=1 Tax=Tuber borchii TaxID=42251 RepID=A0A2T6ZXM7_TUBBO|nr:hypothetical protein B9Z19DRAFT_1063594 [Tuber borchii]